MAGLGAINGTVKDASGAVVPGAKVIVSNPSTGIRRSLETNESGLFAAPSLPPSSGYQVTVTKDGFAGFEAKELQILVGQNLSLNVTLDVKAQVQEVTISESTPIIDQLKTGVSQVVEDKDIQNLPINGRRVDSFVLLSPGVTEDGTFGLLTFRGVPGGNAFLTDGNDTTQGYYNENSGRTRISSNMSQDAVQEFQVQSSGFTAEFGRSVGGTVNTVTKSGTNSVHGTGYWFFRNQDFNARDRYAAINPPERRNQFGGSVGGPIKKDKLFYFVNGELSRRDFPMASSVTNPLSFTVDGNFIGTCAAPATAAQCSAAINYFGRFFGLVPRTADQNAVFAKIDWRPNERNSITVSGNIMNWFSPNGIQTQATLNNGSGLGSNGDSSVKTRFGRISHTGIITPSLVNELRFGYMKDRLYDTVNPALAPPNGLQGQLNVTGVGSTLGVVTYLPRVQPTEDRVQIADNLTWLKGKHNIKVGFDFANTKDTIDLLDNSRGTYTYSSFTNFALDYTNLDGGKRWQSYSQTFGDRMTKVYVRDYNFFAQDQYKVNSRLTLNYGIRYEYAQFSQPTVTNPAYPQSAVINQPGKNFAPRLGVAYTLDKKGKTVLRAGYGIFYARTPGAAIGALFSGNGIVQRPINLQGSNATSLAAGPIFPNFLPGNGSNLPAGSVSLGFAAPDLATPYTQMWDIGIEREINRSTGITVSYLASRGVKFYYTRDLNIGPMGPEVTYRINDFSGNQVGSYTTPTYLFANRIDKNYQRVTQLENGGRLWYDALVVQVRRRAGRWMQGNVGYTWSHASDLNQGGGSNNTFFASTDFPRTIFNGDYSGQKGASSLDQRHRLVISGLISPPRWKTTNQAANYLVNDWQMTFIATAASARYATPTLATSSLPFSGAAFSSTLNGYGGDNRVPFWARSSVPIDEVGRVDARLMKSFGWADRYRATFSFEAFNVFNHVSNTSVFTQGMSSSGNVIRPVTGLGTGSASQGFPDGTNARRAQIGLRFLF
jgi:hypothetical protein